LEDLIEKRGTRLDAEVSSQLLQSLFQPGTPLHDGAVVIRETKVAAAGVQMPTADNPNIPREFGMRHRAAIGVTEDTDAIAVVVSEETGRVSMCVRGQIHLGKDRTALQQDLLQYLRLNGEDVGIRGLIRATRRRFGPWHKSEEKGPDGSGEKKE
ncbi:MAG TPA: DNA integrity scanning protein DisA nucleotide-binding domain protein, partial [Planctomycetota bacterium]|nr:DNA integrity scanning protein DisA nucleotide-binding domain protein [Planctomycetota bacterium]